MLPMDKSLARRLVPLVNKEEHYLPLKELLLGLQAKESRAMETEPSAQVMYQLQGKLALVRQLLNLKEDVIGQASEKKRN